MTCLPCYILYLFMTWAYGRIGPWPGWLTIIFQWYHTHPTRKIVPKMTYNLSRVTLNPARPYRVVCVEVEPSTLHKPHIIHPTILILSSNWLWADTVMLFIHWTRLFHHSWAAYSSPQTFCLIRSKVRLAVGKKLPILETTPTSHLYIYIVKRRRPRFVGGAIEISLIDWLILMCNRPHSTYHR